MDELKLTAENISHSFNSGVVFKSVSFSVETNSPLAIIGGNGSGKSTLLKIISGLLSPVKGEIGFYISGQTQDIHLNKKLLSLYAPYINLYDELTGIENLRYFHRLRFSEDTDYKALLKKVGLEKSKDKLYKSYSSGMKQRLRLAFAISGETKFLMMDEPTTNLDESGAAIVHDVMKEQVKRGVLIVASNVKSDLAYCNSELNIEDYRK